MPSAATPGKPTLTETVTTEEALTQAGSSGTEPNNRKDSIRKQLFQEEKEHESGAAKKNTRRKCR